MVKTVPITRQPVFTLKGADELSRDLTEKVQEVPREDILDLLIF
jgi:hypothetical protein